MPRYTARANDGTLIAFGTDHAIGYFFDKFSEPNDREPPSISLSTYADGLTAKQLVELLESMLSPAEQARHEDKINEIRPKKVMIPAKGDALQALADAYKGATHYETEVEVWYGCRDGEWGWQISRASEGVPDGVDPVFYIAGFRRNGEAIYGEHFELIFGDWRPLGDVYAQFDEKKKAKAFAAKQPQARSTTNGAGLPSNQGNRSTQALLPKTRRQEPNYALWLGILASITVLVWVFVFLF